MMELCLIIKTKEFGREDEDMGDSIALQPRQRKAIAAAAPPCPFLLPTNQIG
jgi:hypothetical protein